tara:strand:+ start:241 stop:1026 length:786 start_codon:yes stop_codon:yes gene_type:complete
MRLATVIFSAILAFSSAHFNVEDYARVYRQKRHEFIQAKHAVIMSEGPYIAARNAYIAATAMLSNAEIPSDNADPRQATSLSGDQLVGSVDSVEVTPPSRRLQGRKLADTDVVGGNGETHAARHENDNVNNDVPLTPGNDVPNVGDNVIDQDYGVQAGDDIVSGEGTNAQVDLPGPSISEQMQKYSDDYQNSRSIWLSAKHRLTISEGPYLAAREAYLVAANSYTNTLIPKTGQPHLWDTIFNRDNYANEVKINKVLAPDI